jgi:hypothetical protein
VVWLPTWAGLMVGRCVGNGPEQAASYGGVLAGRVRVTVWSGIWAGLSSGSG